jgi:transglutaminase-like putative cysteine protease
MLLKLSHQTTLTYSDVISESVMELRVAPRQEHDQHRLSFDLAIGPPTTVNSYFDWLGNTVHAFTVNAFHKEIRIVASSVVETDRPTLDAAQIADTWPPVRRDDDFALFDYLAFGGPVVDSPELRELAASLNPTDGMPLGELATRMLSLINDRFTYEKGLTTSASPISDVLAHRKGVCQDFTHLMIGLARALGIPSRYVSGLIHPQGERYRGYTQTHAWVELHATSAPSGWIGFDPTNQCIIGPNFVKVAVGRDYRDVPPNKGVYRGQAKESIDVQVQSLELVAIPPELAAERFKSLSVPAYARAGAAHEGLAPAKHQQEQQQQELTHRVIDSSTHRLNRRAVDTRHATVSPAVHHPESDSVKRATRHPERYSAKDLGHTRVIRLPRSFGEYASG